MQARDLLEAIRSGGHLADSQRTLAQKDGWVLSSCTPCSIMLHSMDATRTKSRDYVIKELSGFVKNTAQSKLSVSKG